MNWLFFVIIAVLADSLRIFIDNYTSDVYFKGRNAASQKLFNGYSLAIIAFILFIISGFNFNNITPVIAFLIILSGILHGFAGVPYFRALELDESTNIGIFNQLAPVLYLILGWFFLDESFSPLQLIAFAIIIAAPVLIILTTRKKSRKIKLKAVLFAFLYVLIAVAGNILFVKVNSDSINFTTSIGLVLIGKSIADFIVGYGNPKFRKRFFTVCKSSHRKVLIPLTINSIIGGIQQFTYRAALITAPAVAIASAASDSAEPIVIFFLGLVLTLIWPRFGREKLDKKTVLVHLVATVLVVVGVVLLQM